MGIVRFRNVHFAAITGYGDYVQGNLMICHVYYVEGLGHNLFSVGQFCDGDLEVAFRSNTCYVQILEGDDLLTACEQGKSKKASLPSKLVPSTESKLELLQMDLCGPMRVANLDNLFGPLYEKYYATSSPEVLVNSAANTLNNKHTSSSSLIVVKEDEAPQIVSSSAEQVTTKPNSLVLNENDNELVQEDTKNHPIEQVIGDPSKPVMIRNWLQNDAEVCMYTLTVSTIEPKNIKEALLDHRWIESMQDEQNQFKRLDVWELVECPNDRNIIAMDLEKQG
ncbi:hypothetical protein Tco_0247596 [Tanacetum coccineum]